MCWNKEGKIEFTLFTDSRLRLSRWKGKGNRIFLGLPKDVILGSRLENCEKRTSTRILYARGGEYFGGVSQPHIWWQTERCQSVKDLPLLVVALPLERRTWLLRLRTHPASQPPRTKPDPWNMLQNTVHQTEGTDLSLQMATDLRVCQCCYCFLRANGKNANPTSWTQMFQIWHSWLDKWKVNGSPVFPFTDSCHCEQWT